MRSRRTLALAGVAAVAAVVVSASLGAAAATRRSASAAPPALRETSTVDEILDRAATAGDGWRSAHVKGHFSLDGQDRPFETWVEKGVGYRSVEGESMFVRNRARQWEVAPGHKMASEFAVPSSLGQARAQMDARLAADRAEDPSVAREGDFVVDTPVNDLINPGYLVRKELRLAAKSVRKVGTATVGGRKTVQLRVEFPEELAKEDHWDVYVDIATGMLLRLVIEPVPGNPRYVACVDSLEVDRPIASGLFDYDPPAGFKVTRAVRP